MSKRVLITGAAGFIGQNLAEYLLEKGFEIHGIDRPGIRQPNGWKSPWYAIDVLDKIAVYDVLKSSRPNYIFHLAALTKSNSLGDLLRTNVLGTENILNAIVSTQLKARILIPGSSAEYGIALHNELPITESNPLRPLNSYGVSKVAQSLHALQFGRIHDLDVLCTRTFNLTGPGEPETLVCSAFARQIAEIEIGLRKPVINVGNLESSRDFTDVRDAVHAYWGIIRDGITGETYNVCSGRAIKIRVVLDLLLKETSSSIIVQDDFTRHTEGDVSCQFGDARKLLSAVRWSPTIPIEKSLRDILFFWRKKILNNI